MKDRLIAGLIFLITITAVSFVLALFGRGICIIYNTTGVPCPSCGMTRAWLCFFRGELSMAFFNHPLFLTVLLIPSLLLKRIRKFSNIIAIVIISVYILIWVVRMFTLFPHTPPMNFDSTALIPSIFIKLFD